MLLVLVLGWMPAAASATCDSWESLHPLPDARGYTAGVFANGHYTVVGTSGLIATSSDLAAWTTIESGVGQDLHAIAWTGSRYLVTGDDGVILSSSDGLAWRREVSPTNFALRGLACSTVRCVAVGDQAVVLSSTDGSSWTISQPPLLQEPATLFDVEWNGSQFVAVGGPVYDSDHYYLHHLFLASTDGLTWSMSSIRMNEESVSAVAWNGSTWLALGDHYAAYTSPDGTTWTEIRPPVFEYGVETEDLVWTGSEFVGVGLTMIRSTDGVEWELIDDDPPRWVRGAFVGYGKVVALGKPRLVLSSSHGREWTPESALPGAVSTVYDIIWAHDRLIAPGYGGILTSTDGTSWESPDIGYSAWLYAGASSGSRTVVVGYRTLETTTDGVVWEYRLPSPPAGGGSVSWLYDIVWTGEQFVAVGDKYILLSSDGLDWEVVDSDDRRFAAVSWTGERLVAVVRDLYDEFGYPVTSLDGRTWEPAGSALTFYDYGDYLNDVAAGGDRVVAVGDNGEVLVSRDGLQFDIVTRPVEVDLRAVIWTGDRFVAAGSGTVLASVDGEQWSRIDSDGVGGILGLGAVGSDLYAVGSGGAIERQRCLTPPTPVASAFEWSPQSPAAGLEIEFHDTSSAGVNAWRWDFNDGTEDGSQHPTHRFPIPGTYPVTLTVSDGRTMDSHTEMLEVAGPADNCTQPKWITPVRPPASLRDAVFGKDLFVAVGAAGTVMISETGTSWSEIYTRTGSDLNALAFDGDRFTAVGSDGTVLSSADATAWQVDQVEGGPDLSAITVAGDRMVTVGEGGAIATRTAGGAWRREASPTVEDLEDVASNGLAIVAVGDYYQRPENRYQPIIVTSHGDAGWSLVEVSAPYGLGSVVWTGSEFLAFPGRSGWPIDEVLVSSDGDAWHLEPWDGIGIRKPRVVGDRLVATTTISSSVAFAESNDGRTWSETGLALEQATAAIAGAGNRLVAVTDRGAIAVSADDGASWFAPHLTPFGLNDAVWYDGGFVAVGASIVVGAERSSWKSMATESELRAIARRGQRLVAVGNAGAIVISDDGATWQSVEPITDTDLLDIADNGSGFVAVDDSGGAITSQDGLAWSPVTFPGELNPSRIIAGAGELVAFDRSTTTAGISSDGVAWDAVELPFAPSGVAWGNGLFVAIGDDGRIATSADAREWNEIAPISDVNLGEIVFTGRLFVASGWALLAVSTDGLGWATAETTASSGKLVTDGSRAVRLSDWFASADGLTWAPMRSDVPQSPRHGSPPRDYGWTSIARNEDIMVAAGTDVMASTDERAWHVVASPPGGVTDVIWDGTRFIAVGRSVVLTSNDGTIWSSVDFNSCSAVASNGSTLVAVGNETIFASSDGASWQQVASLPMNLFDAVWDGERFVAVGGSHAPAGGWTTTAIATSPDGRDWTIQWAGDGPWLYAVATNGHRTVAVGSVTHRYSYDQHARAVAFTSADGISWQRSNIPGVHGLSGITATSDGFVAVGSSGDIVRSPDGISWTTMTRMTDASLADLAETDDGLIVVGSGIFRLGCDATPTVHEPGGSVRVVPAAAHVDGAAGTTWRTDVVLHNSSHSEAHANAFFLAQGEDNAATPGVPVIVPPRSSLALDDAIAATFGRSSDAGGILLGSDLPLTVSSRTFNDADSGTFGQFIPGVAVDDAFSEPVWLIQLAHDAKFRTNIGLVNPTADEIELAVDLFTADGAWLNTRTHRLPPYGAIQDNGIFAKVTSDEITDGYAIVHAAGSATRFFTYASVADNRSGDPIYIAPRRSSREPQWVPAVAHVEGAADTHWRSDVEVGNPGPLPVEFNLELVGGDGTSSSVDYTLDPGVAARYDDIVGDVFSDDGAGALQVTGADASVLVSSRTYNDLGTTTYGQYIPAFAESDATPEGATVRLVQLSRSPEGAPGFRTNIGVVNISAVPITVTIELFDDHGETLGERVLELGARSFEQVNDVFLKIGVASIGLASAAVRSETPGARFFTYASLVDRQSGDPTFIHQP
jgi:PKD repeat protein